MGELSVENLLELPADKVKGQVVQVFTELLKRSGSVYGTFFKGAPQPPVALPGTESAWATWLDECAVALVCSAIPHSSTCNFAQTINGASAETFIKEELEGETKTKAGLEVAQWLYAWAFPTYCGDGTNTFALYLPEKERWAEELADQMSSTAGINVWINKYIGTDPEWLAKLNLVFYKLHLLDEAQEQRTVNAWAAAYPKAIEQWQTYNFLEGNRWGYETFLQQVLAAISAHQSNTQCASAATAGSPAADVGAPMTTPVCWETTVYGEAVVSFLGGKPAQMGLTTGQSAENVVTRNISPGGCFVPGTPVRLADGEAVPIETVGDGARVLGQDGVVGIHTDERVVYELETEIALYGFNDEEPFFSAGHAFWTDDGWKAVDPSVAAAENPWREVGQLKPGDAVHRLTSYDPPTYERVEVERIDGRIAQPGERIHGLHLFDTATYHANDYLVAMNYPVITERRLADSFAALSATERELLAADLERMMPLLRRCLGSWLEGPLLRALRGR